MATATVTFYPSAIGSTSISGSVSNPSNPVGKGSDNTTYSNWNMKTGSNAESYVFYSFDCSSIPEGATITSVTCSAKAYVSSTSRVTSRAMQMYTGSTAKGSAQTNISTTASAQTITCGSWTRAELLNAQIRIYGKRGTSGTSYTASMRFYGATLTVTYQYEDKKVYAKKNGAWVEYDEVYKKINGTWVQQEKSSSVIDSGKALVFGGEYSPAYLCFTAEQDDSSVALNVNGTPTQGQVFYTSTNAKNWTQYTIGTVISLNTGDKVYWKGDNSTVSESSSVYFQFEMSGSIAGSGNIMSLLDSTCESTIISHSYCFRAMFWCCTSLTTPPVLPATTLLNNCYHAMFQDCTSLITAPVLPATTMATECYWSMFENCYSLETAPALPATTLADWCYQSMFRGCWGLETAPELPATTLAKGCYYNMFYDCEYLTTPPALPATTLVERCYYGMFEYCYSLETAPALPATTLAVECYEEMFYECTSLTTAPSLPATTLAEDCYDSMFFGCTSLTTPPALPATTLDDYCYTYMFYGCTSLKVYSSPTSGADKAWRIPTSGSVAEDYLWQDGMFRETTGDYSETEWVEINATFYTQNTPV